MKITGNKEKYCDRDSIPSEKYADGRPQGPGADPSGSFGENTPALADERGSVCSRVNRMPSVNQNANLGLLFFAILRRVLFTDKKLPGFVVSGRGTSSPTGSALSSAEPPGNGVRRNYKGIDIRLYTALVSAPDGMRRCKPG